MTPPTPTRDILIVEDDEAIATGLSLNLRLAGHNATIAPDGDAALTQLADKVYDLVLLDINLPRRNGLEVLGAMREADNVVPVIVLSARDGEYDKVAALRLGADDYVTKPFSVAELIARINAIFRRQQRLAATDEAFAIGPWTVNARKHTLTKGRQSKRLTFYELEVLKLLRERADDAVSRDELLEKVWGVQGNPTNRTVDNFIVKLRRKLEEDQKNPRHILTVYGYGYKLVP